ncbi:hypothetical protein DVH24_041559 [Malus domestica]|uniref:Uncharacterized protein n=1 Tax=Malus domestica TaxID=3750 RepID=A0A498IE61_MALDO|nr:hypothetical protein DVH24_041559 [Malus domestica]
MLPPFVKPQAALSKPSTMEYVSPEGLRLDGRRPMEMRQIRGEIGVVDKVDGSAVFEMGITKVIAAVRCEYTMANFSTGDRMRKPKEISLVIRQTMEACIMTHLMPRTQIDIFVQVLQADGGTRSACINAATLALSDAGIPMRDLVTSCSAGYLNSTPLLDVNYVEDSAGGADVTLGIMPKLDKVTLLQMDAKLPLDIFENVMQLSIEGCKAVATYIREVLLENTKQLEYRRGTFIAVLMKFDGGYIMETVFDGGSRLKIKHIQSSIPNQRAVFRF